MQIPFFDVTGPGNSDLPSEVLQILALSRGQYATKYASRFELNWRYYQNTQYSAEFLSGATRASEEQRMKELWSGVRPLFNVCTTVVDTDVRHIFKKARPLPTVPNNTLEDRLRTMWVDRRWGLKAKPSVQVGAVTGHSYLRVVPGILDGDPSYPARLQVYSPEIMSVLHDQHNHENLIAAKIQYEFIERHFDPKAQVGSGNQYYSIYTNHALDLAPSEQVHVYTMVITASEYFTFRDGELWGYNGMPGRWPNTLGIVPVISVPFIDIGHDLGLPTFHSVIDTLDAINVLSSLFGQILKIHGDPTILAYGIKEGTVNKQTTVDGSTILYIPTPNIGFSNQAPIKPSMEYLEWKGSNAAPLLAFLKEIKNDVEAALPEMAFQKGEKRAGSGFELSLDLQEGVEKIEMLREAQFTAVQDALVLGLLADDLGEQELPPEEAYYRLMEARAEYNITMHADTVLPRDRTTEAQITSVAIADGTLTQRTAMLRSGMSYAEADAEEKQRELEHQKELRWMREQLQVYADMGVTPRGAAATLTPGGVPKKITGSIPQGSAGNINNGRNNGTAATKPGQPIAGANKNRAGQPNTRPNSPPDQGSGGHKGL